MKRRSSLRNKLIALVCFSMIPMVILAVYLVISLKNYSEAYDEIVSNMTVANSYNLNFKEEMDESTYKLVVGSATFETIEEKEQLRSPYIILEELSRDFTDLLEITTDKDSRAWLLSLLRNIDTLEDRIDDIRDNVNQGGRYDENILMLDNNIYILTELIQDDIQYYIHYQTKSIEQLKIQLNEQVDAFVVMYAMVGVFILVGTISITVLEMYRITKPINELCAVTKTISEGNFSQRVEVNRRDEIGELAYSVNQMSEHLEEYVDKIKEDERKMRHAELRLLQEQINPHFLYNTLDTIVWLVEGNHSDKAVNVVVSLSDFFRIVLSKGREVITIREEEKHIRSYLEIQQVRYRDILDYEIDIEEKLYPYYIQKLTLQPLVENALYHGIKTKRAKGTIRVIGRLDGDCIRLEVSDDGIGMDVDTLARIRNDITKPCKETEAGFGLANVNERIRMNYGAEYGMKIDSVEGKGTTIVVTIPAHKIDTEGKGEL